MLTRLELAELLSRCQPEIQRQRDAIASQTGRADPTTQQIVRKELYRLDLLLADIELACRTLDRAPNGRPQGTTGHPWGNRRRFAEHLEDYDAAR